jgi:MoaA/NifB/PqqE/SkfB family radical SAM enzyme
MKNSTRGTGMDLIATFRKLREHHALRALLHPGVIANFLRYPRESGRRPTEMGSTPVGLEIELTNRCNLACTQCLRSLGLRPYELGEIRFEDYQRILEQFPHTLNLCLNGFGEPLMHPRFLDIVRYTRRRMPWAKIGIYSNGMLLDEACARQLPGSGLTEIDVSIDAARPETYRRVRRGGELGTVHENIARLIRIRREVGARYPLVGVNFVMLNENEGELVPFLDQAAALGVDMVNTITYATYDWGFRNRRSKESYVREVAAARRRLEELRLRCKTLPSDDFSWSHPDRVFDCGHFWGTYGVRVTFQGHLTLGCCTPFKETYSYGNLLETPFRELWNGHRFRQNREMTRRAQPPSSVCASCDRFGKAFFDGTEAAPFREAAPTDGR